MGFPRFLKRREAPELHRRVLHEQHRPRHDPGPLGLLSFRGFSEVARASERDACTHLLAGPSRGTWPDPFFYDLSEAERESGRVSLVRLRCIADHPVMLERTYLADPGGAGELDALGRGSLFAMLEQTYGIRVVGVDQDIRAVRADASTGGVLGVEQGAPVLHLYRRYVTTRDGFHVYSSLFCNTERYSIRTTFS
jgi:DNA-binding GntR family transcriptional regulator